MKTLLTIAISLLIASSIPSFALDNYPFSIGASISGIIIGTNTGNTPGGVNNALAAMKGFNALVLGYFPMSDESRTGVMVGAGLTSNHWGLKDTFYNQTGYITQSLFTIYIGAMISGFSFGVDFGLSEKYSTDDFNLTYHPYSSDLNAAVRAGYMYPLYTNSLGTLNISADATYNITDLQYYGDYAFKPVTLCIGLNYLFNLGYEGEDSFDY